MWDRSTGCLYNKGYITTSGGRSLGKEAEVLWHAVMLVAVYFIWKSRNMKVFKGKTGECVKTIQGNTSKVL